MTLRLSWAELSKIASEHVAKSGLNLGPARVLGPAPYGPEEIEIDATAFEFPIITEMPFVEAPLTTEIRRIHPEPLSPSVIDHVVDDIPF